jgi:ribosomal protein S17E
MESLPSKSLQNHIAPYIKHEIQIELKIRTIA